MVTGFARDERSGTVHIADRVHMVVYEDNHFHSLTRLREIAAAPPDAAAATDPSEGTAAPEQLPSMASPASPSITGAAAGTAAAGANGRSQLLAHQPTADSTEAASPTSSTASSSAAFWSGGFEIVMEPEGGGGPVGARRHSGWREGLEGEAARWRRMHGRVRQRMRGQ